MLFFKRFSFCYLFFWFFCFSVVSETLIIQSSDQHSSYKKMINFLASIEALYRDFKDKHPQGSVALVINGDFSSRETHSKIQGDKGDFGYEILGQLAKKYSVIYTFGNHDAFDWNDSQLFLDQMNLLKHAGVNLIVSNVRFFPEHEGLFNSYVDLVLKKGQALRFVGYTLPYRKKDALLKFQHKGPKVIDRLTSIDMAGPLQDANTEQEITAVIMSLHLGLSKLKIWCWVCPFS